MQRPPVIVKNSFSFSLSTESQVTMFAERFFFALIVGIALQHVAQAELLGANDMQTCIELCAGCDGTATFKGRVCQCHVADDNQQGSECVARLKRQATELGVDLVSCEPADAERPARCLLGTRTNGNPCLVAQYFKNGGPLNGINGFAPYLGSLNPKSADDNTLHPKTSNDAPNKYAYDPNDKPVGSVNSGILDTDSRSSSPWARQTVGATDNFQNPHLGHLLGYDRKPQAFVESSYGYQNPHNFLVAKNHGQEHSSPMMDSMQNNMVGANAQPMHQPIAGMNPQYVVHNPQYMKIDPLVGAPPNWPYYILQNPSQPDQLVPNIDPEVAAANPGAVKPSEAVAENPNKSPDSVAANPIVSPKTVEEVPKDKEPEAGDTGENVGESHVESAAEEKPEKKFIKKYTKDMKVGSMKSKKMKDSMVAAADPGSGLKLNKMKKAKESGNETEDNLQAEKDKESVHESKLKISKEKENDHVAPAHV